MCFAVCGGWQAGCRCLSGRSMLSVSSLCSSPLTRQQPAGGALSSSKLAGDCNLQQAPLIFFVSALALTLQVVLFPSIEQLRIATYNKNPEPIISRKLTQTHGGR